MRCRIRLRRIEEGESNPIDELDEPMYASRFPGVSQSDESRVNSSAAVGAAPSDIQRYSMNRNPLTYAVKPHT